MKNFRIPKFSDFENSNNYIGKCDFSDAIIRIYKFPEHWK